MPAQKEIRLASCEKCHETFVTSSEVVCKACAHLAQAARHLARAKASEAKAQEAKERQTAAVERWKLISEDEDKTDQALVMHCLDPSPYRKTARTPAFVEYLDRALADYRRLAGKAS